MNTNEFNIIDIIKIIVKNYFLRFFLYFLFLTIIFSVILFYFQKNIISKEYNLIKFKIYELDKSANQDYLLFDKINNLFQSTIVQKLNLYQSTIVQNNDDANPKKNEEIFFSQSFNDQMYYNLFFQHITNEMNIVTINQKNQTSFILENKGIGNVDINEKKVFFVEFKDYDFHDEKKYYNFIKDLQNEGFKLVNNQYKKNKLEFEKHNMFILNNLSLYIEEQKINYFNKQEELSKFELNKLNSTSVLINRYLDKLNINNKDYIGNLVESSEIQIAKIDNISSHKIESNINFIILRSIILSFIASFIIVFFYFLSLIHIVNSKKK